jgi:hypothetical protein
VYGAPIAISSSHPPALYVPDETVMRRFRRPALRHPPTAAHNRRNGNAVFRQRWHVGHAPTLHPGRHFERQQTINGQPQPKLSHNPIVVPSQRAGARPAAIFGRTTATHSRNTAESNMAGYQ